MKSRNIILSWLTIVVLTCVTNSCKVIDRADGFYEYMEYTKAIPKYRRALEKDSTNTEAWGRLGDCYRLNNQTIEAEACYKKSVQNPGAKSVYKLYYAQMMVTNGKYAEAHHWIDDYMKSDPADSRIAAIDSGINHVAEFTAEKDNYRVEKLNINTTEAEYGPALYKDGIIFTSSRESESVASKSHSWTGKNYYSLYYAKGSRTKFDNPVIFLKGIQTKYNNSSACFTKDGNEMMLTRNNVENGKVLTSTDRVVKLKLFSSVMKDGAWTNAVPFPYNSNQYSCAHPAYSPDGKKLYFSSDMPGSIGGMDLWVCNRTNEGWSQPVNLGPVVNTKGNELFPTVADDGTIYFSSNGREGLGGLDIYSTTESGGSYSQPKNAGAPINSSDDDFGLIRDAKNNIGYLSSNRSQQGNNDDIFCLIKNTSHLVGLVYDKHSGKPLDQAAIQILEEGNAFDAKQTDTGGNFTSAVHQNKNYQFIAERTSYKTDTLKLTAADITAAGDTVFVKIPLEKEVFLITMTGKITNETTGNPVDSAKVILINQTGHDTVRTVTGIDGTYSFADLKPECHYRVFAEAKYCIMKSADISTIGVEEDKNLVVNLSLYCLSDHMVLHNIYYDLNKYNIRPDAAIELDKLVELMKKYPQIQIELGSHTDCRASAAYNMKLSQNRAKSAVEYLVQHGINRKRMTAQGYGESMLVNHCECEGDRKVDCTEEEHQLNRRTEVKILSWNWTASML